jgi:hypothetical protein
MVDCLSRFTSTISNLFDIIWHLGVRHQVAAIRLRLTTTHLTSPSYRFYVRLVDVAFARTALRISQISFYGALRSKAASHLRPTATPIRATCGPALLYPLVLPGAP